MSLKSRLQLTAAISVLPPFGMNIQSGTSKYFANGAHSGDINIDSVPFVPASGTTKTGAAVHSLGLATSTDTTMLQTKGGVTMLNTDDALIWAATLLKAHGYSVGAN